MIKESFMFLDGVKQGMENKIHSQGIGDWDDFISARTVGGISASRKNKYDLKINEARRELYDGNSAYFLNRLPSTEHWRLYEHFKDETLFLDIETSHPGSDGYITVVGMFDGIDTKTMVKGINLDFYLLAQEIRRYKLLVTFNGSVFDIPFIKKRFPELIPRMPNIDLRFVCSRLGMSGGLKDIEKQLGIERQNKIVDSMYGGDAISLYRMWRGSGDDYYLKLLVEYNEEDCVNLKYIADKVIPKIKAKI